MKIGALWGLPDLHRGGRSPRPDETRRRLRLPGGRYLVVRTRSEKVDKIRKMILELLLAHAPDAPVLQDLAKEYGADKDRFEKEASFCIHCGLCVRYCAEVKKKNAVGFVDRGTEERSAFIPGDRRQGMLELQGMFSALPYVGAAGRLYADAGADFPSMSSPIRTQKNG